MPWPNFARMSDEDLKPIYACLQTLTLVKNLVTKRRAGRVGSAYFEVTFRPPRRILLAFNAEVSGA